jgi:ATP-dependent DNA helicase PIF1
MSILHDSLSADQVSALEKFKRGGNLFITGPGGTGKTRLIHHLVQYCRAEQKEVQVCAMTGCAAILLGNGAKTLHSWSGMRLGRGTKAQIVAAIRSNPRAAKNWKTVKVLILDEVSMLSKKLFEAIEEAARTVRRNPARFGGIQVIFTGDFFQLPPVGSPTEPDTASFCFESPIWESVFQIQNHVELKTIFRQTDPIYKEILMEIRRGTISDANAEILKKYVGREKPADCVPTKLFAVRAKADFVNKAMYDKLKKKNTRWNIFPRRI